MKNNLLNKTLTYRTGKDIAKLLIPNQEHISNLHFSSPSTNMETDLYAIWKSVLGHDNFGINENFFKTGGNSLKAVQLVSRIATQFSIDINLTDVFLKPTIKELATLILNTQMWSTKPMDVFIEFFS